MKKLLIFVIIGVLFTSCYSSKKDYRYTPMPRSGRMCDYVHKHWVGF